ncbi:MAG: hypothetical protein ACK4RK_13310 [Gemmataceae bacterium]
MPLTAPEWLARRGGAIRKDPAHDRWVVLLDGAPQYVLTPKPMAGRFGCAVQQTINGKHLESSATYATEDEALKGGLEDLRKGLGW